MAGSAYDEGMTVAPTYSAPPSITFADGLERIVGESEALSATVGELAEDVRATLAVGTLAGDPIQHQRGTLNSQNYADYRPHPDLLDRAIARAEELGLKVIKIGRFGITDQRSGPVDRRSYGIALGRSSAPEASPDRGFHEFCSGLRSAASIGPVPDTAKVSVPASDVQRNRRPYRLYTSASLLRTVAKPTCLQFSRHRRYRDPAASKRAQRTGR
jgi:hypothetical protein